MLRISTAILAALIALTTFAQVTLASADEQALAQATDSRSEEARSRDGARHPQQTLAFFKVEPGMTVAEVLPGSGWYTAILANYLGGDGALFGINYPQTMWPLFNQSDKWVAEHVAATAKFPGMVKGFTDNGIATQSFTFNTVPQEVAGTVDRILMIRALHNLNRFESVAGTRTHALAAMRSMLKDNGLVGVVQHRAPESASNEWADGSKGYLKQSAVIAMFEAMNFQLLATSEANANPKDQPGVDDIVWRLPPSLSTSREDPELHAAMLSIGESDRMTLLFRKLP